MPETSPGRVKMLLNTVAEHLEQWCRDNDVTGGELVSILLYLGAKCRLVGLPESTNEEIHQVFGRALAAARVSVSSDDDPVADLDPAKAN